MAWLGSLRKGEFRLATGAAWRGEFWFGMVFMNENAKDRLAIVEKERWAILVKIAMSGASSEVPKHKFQAIQFAKEAGSTEEAIIAAGQGATLSSYAKAKKNGNERQRVLRWRISASLADAIQCDMVNEDAEEPLVSRLIRLLGIKTSEELWMFIHSVFRDFSDEDIIHSGGEAMPKKSSRRGQAR